MSGTITDNDPFPLRAEGVRAAMLDALRAGCAVTDIAFDRIYPERIRRLSPRVWTPVQLSEEGSRRDVARVEEALDRAPTGTRVVTFHGFGGVMPPAYRHLAEETRGTAFLRLWVKALATTRFGDRGPSRLGPER